MKIINYFMIFLAAAFLAACNHTDINRDNTSGIQPVIKETKIIQSWQGDYPVSHLGLLPKKQQQLPVGFFDDAETFESVWQAFKPGDLVPVIDFKATIVIFVRNTQFYNRISIGKVIVTKGIAEVLSMETMSAMPIEDKVAMSMVLVNRDSIKGIISGDKIIPVID